MSSSEFNTELLVDSHAPDDDNRYLEILEDDNHEIANDNPEAAPDIDSEYSLCNDSEDDPDFQPLPARKSNIRRAPSTSYDRIPLALRRTQNPARSSNRTTSSITPVQPPSSSRTVAPPTPNPNCPGATLRDGNILKLAFPIIGAVLRI